VTEPGGSPAEVREAAEILARTPAILAAWLPGLSTPWLAADEGPGTFDPWDVVAHLADNEEVDWLPRLEIVLAHGESRAFAPYDREAFRTRFGGWPIDRLVARFGELRRANLARLHALALAPADLERTGMHPALGRVTLRQLLAGWAVHDLTHVAQIARVMAKRYATAVGPWRAYLGVLGDREK